MTGRHISLWLTPAFLYGSSLEIDPTDLWNFSICCGRFPSGAAVDIFYAKEKAAFGVIHIQWSGNVSIELVGRLRLKAKGQTGLAPTLRLLCPPALFFHHFSRSAGIFRDTKTSRCHVTGGLPPLNNACLFWEILPRAKEAFGIGSIIPAAALEFDEGAAKYCGTSFCLFVCLWLVCLAIRQNQQPVSHLNEVPAAVWFPQCPHFYKKDQTMRSKNRLYIKKIWLDGTSTA